VVAPPPRIFDCGGNCPYVSSRRLCSSGLKNGCWTKLLGLCSQPSPQLPRAPVLLRVHRLVRQLHCLESMVARVLWIKGQMVAKRQQHPTTHSTQTLQTGMSSFHTIPVRSQLWELAQNVYKNVTYLLPVLKTTIFLYQL